MIDGIYVIGMLVFFAAMVGYVAACERLGRLQAPSEGEHDTR